MSTYFDFSSYLECGENKLNSEFPNCGEVTKALFQKTHDFLNIDFEGLSDNRIYRYFLSNFNEMICLAFEKNASQKYMRSFFEIMSSEQFVEFLTNKAKSKAKDIQFLIERLWNFFVYAQYGFNNSLLEEIISYIDGQM